MKAIIVRSYGDPDVMKIEETAPPKPGPGQVLVRIRAAGVNPADTYARSGMTKTPLPYTPGSDGAGEVEAVGPDVKSVKPGDRVYTARTLSGTYAEYALAQEPQVQRLPEKISADSPRPDRRDRSRSWCQRRRGRGRRADSARGRCNGPGDGGHRPRTGACAP